MWERGGLNRRTEVAPRLLSSVREAGGSVWKPENTSQDSYGTIAGDKVRIVMLELGARSDKS